MSAAPASEPSRASDTAMAETGTPYDPLSPENWPDPYPVYKRMRDEVPVYRVPEPDIDSEMYVVSRYEDVVAVFRDTERFSSTGAFTAALEAQSPHVGPREVFEMARFVWRSRMNPLRIRQILGTMLITLDPPRHDVLRGVVNRGFTPRRIRDWEPRIREIVAECVARRRPGRPYELVKELAVPLPVGVIAEILGIPPEREADLKRWSDLLTNVATGSGRTDTVAPFLNLMGEMAAYLRELAAERRARPKDDLVSVMVDPAHEETLDTPTLFTFAVLLIFAGNETTTNLIANMVTLLLENPDQLELLRRDPSLAAGAVEEALRFESPVQLMLRRSTRDTEIAGVPVPADARVALLLGSANRDERMFPDPDRFDITRSTAGHVAFGHGVHFCLGASLARLEARAALEGLLPILPELRLGRSERQLIDSTLVRGPVSLELVDR